MDDACQNLLCAMQHSIRGLLGRAGRQVGVAFSGGVDSTLLAVVCDSMGYDVTLLTVGFDRSHDAEFAGIVASELGMPHRILTLADTPEFAAAYCTVRDMLPVDDLSWIENSVAFYHVASLARDVPVDTVVTANGIDELFCGYDAYRRLLRDWCGASKDSAGAIYDLMKQKIDNETRMFDAIDLVAGEISVLQPLLQSEFQDAAYKIPLSEKISGPDDMHRKHIIRRLARDVGVPSMSYQKRKKALQYGSGIHKAVLRIRRSGLRRHR